MFDQIPVYFHYSAVSFGAVGVAYGLFKAGQSSGLKKNGYVVKSDCDNNVNDLSNSIELLRSDMQKTVAELVAKINETNVGIGEIKGYLKIR